MTTPLPDAAAVRDGLARCFLRHGVDRPQWLADLAEPIVRTALEERDAEIRRLRDLTAPQRRRVRERAIADIMAATDEQLRDAFLCLSADKRRRLRELLLGVPAGKTGSEEES